ncbi:MAG TPA: hypothetical protein VHF89_09865, partial [Solirubrobacteraceae bacterium]|nr:hypothetical protein [Solirubrobacteraceae bacterium]
MHVHDLPRLAAGLLLIGALTLVSGCGGNAPTRDAPAGTTLHLDGVAYTVQTSRELNADAADSRPFFVGVRAGGRALPADELWLGVFLQAENESDGPRALARSIDLADSMGHT